MATTKKDKGPIAGIVERFDAWGSTVMGIGSELRDKVTSFNFVAGEDQFSKDALKAEAAYREDDIVARIIDTIPNDAMREGFTLNGAEDAEEEEGESLEEQIETSGALSAIEKAWKWGRLYGGGAVWCVVLDGSEQSEPMNIEGIKKVISFRDLTAAELTPVQFYQDPLSPMFGEPELFRIEATAGDGMLQGFVHESRLIKFHGVPRKRSDRRTMGRTWWGSSVLARSQGPLRWFNLVYASTAHLVSDSAQGIFRIKGLGAMVTSGRKDLVQKRMEIVDIQRSVTRALMLDQEEDYTRLAGNFSGLESVITKFDQRLAASVELPLTKLMGTSPGGLSATGESDLQIHYGNVAVAQTQVLKPALNRVIEILTNGQGEWKITFNPLQKLSGLEEAQLRKTVAETDKLYFEMDAVTSEEIALSRFTEEGWDPEMHIDRELRENPPAVAEDTSTGIEEEDPTSDGEPIDATSQAPEI